VRLAIWWLLQEEYEKTFCSWIKKAQLKIGFFIVEDALVQTNRRTKNDGGVARESDIGCRQARSDAVA
jgi:hypothetical protein